MIRQYMHVVSSRINEHNVEARCH